MHSKFNNITLMDSKGPGSGATSCTHTVALSFSSLYVDQIPSQVVHCSHFPSTYSLLFRNKQTSAQDLPDLKSSKIISNWIYLLNIQVSFDNAWSLWEPNLFLLGEFQNLWRVKKMNANFTHPSDTLVDNQALIVEIAIAGVFWTSDTVLITQNGWEALVSMNLWAQSCRYLLKWYHYSNHANHHEINLARRPVLFLPKRATQHCQFCGHERI